MRMGAWQAGGFRARPAIALDIRQSAQILGHVNIEAKTRQADHARVQVQRLRQLQMPFEAVWAEARPHALKSAFAVYDITDPKKARYLDMIVSEGDVSPEGMKAFRADGSYYVAVANEVSDTAFAFQAEPAGRRRRRRG